MAKTPGRSDLPAAPNPASPQDIRNVVLVGPGGAGKTALFEALVAARVPGQRTGTGDHVRTTTLTAASFTSGPVTLNLLDTPGYPDFVGDLRAGLRAADAAVFVVSGADDIDRPVSLLWRECAAVGMPRAVVVTHLDQPRADFATTVETCRRTFGDARATHWPVVDGGSVTGVVGLLTGETSEEHEDARAALIESVIEESEDATLLDRYLEGESIDTESLLTDLRTAIAHGTFFPIVPVSPLTGAGVEELLGIVERAFPDPTVHPLPPITSPVGRCRQRRHVRPVAAARRRGRAHDDRPLRRSPVTRARLLRHPARRRDRCTCRDTSATSSGTRSPVTRRTTTTSASARSPRPSSRRTGPVAPPSPVTSPSCRS